MKPVNPRRDSASLKQRRAELGKRLTQKNAEAYQARQEQNQKRKAKEHRAAWVKEVRWLTEQQPLHQLPFHQLRSEGYQLDHIISLAEGYRLGMRPRHIADITNLQFIPATENARKNSKCYSYLAANSHRRSKQHQHTRQH